MKLSNGNEVEFELKNNQILSKNIIFEFNETITIRCPHIKSGISMINLIKEVKLMKDSIGGIITCVIKNVPQGLGEPCFDKIEALLAHAMLSIPATKGFEIGSGYKKLQSYIYLKIKGFQGVKMLGSQHNDLYIKNEKNNSKIKIKPETNNSGGIIGGITNGENIVRIFFHKI